MSARERLLIAAKAFLQTVRHFLFTITFVPLVGFLAYREIGGLGLFVLGIFSGYLQAFFETCVRNYSTLKSAAEAKEPIRTETFGAIRPARAPAKATNNSSISKFRQNALFVWRVTSYASLIFLVLVLLWNLFLIFYGR